MNNFAKYLNNTSNLLNFALELKKSPLKFSFIMGNKSCDMDSVVGSTLFAYLLFLRDLKESNPADFNQSFISNSIENLAHSEKYNSYIFSYFLLSKNSFFLILNFQHNKKHPQFQKNIRSFNKLPSRIIRSQTRHFIPFHQLLHST